MTTQWDGIDPHGLAAAQLQRDRERTARVLPWIRRGVDLYRHKIDRMAPSPLAFLRGAAPLFYEVLEHHPHLAAGPPGKGFIVGDLHLENFGAFRPEPQIGKHRDKELAAIFDVNDFDDCAIGPWRFDLLRLTTSLVLGGRELGADGRETLSLCDILLAAYVEAMGKHRALPIAPPTVRNLLARVTKRSRKALLDARTEVHRGRRTFVRGVRYLELVPRMRRAAERAFAHYVREHIPKSHREPFEVCDMAFRVAGTGSLGCLRVAVLVRGKGGRDGHWVFDMKEEDGQPSASVVLGPSRLEGALRVEVGLHESLGHVPRGLGVTTMKKLPMLVRRLTPQEDKLDLRRFPREELPALARLLGALVARAHGRGKRKAKRRWSKEDCHTIVDSAVHLAGIHEAAYLAYCRLAER